MMGFDVPGDQRVPVTVRDWTSLKLSVWRSQFAFEIVVREAAAIIERCAHEKDCPGATIETEPCFANCKDREQRMSALVILNAARMFAPVNAQRPKEPYFAPSRESYSETLAELSATQAERDALREILRSMGVEAPTPPQNKEPAQLERKKERFSEEDFSEEERPPIDTEAEEVSGEGTEDEIRA